MSRFDEPATQQRLKAGALRDTLLTLQGDVTAADEHGIAMVFTGTRHFKH